MRRLAFRVITSTLSRVAVAEPRRSPAVGRPRPTTSRPAGAAEQEHPPPLFAGVELEHPLRLTLRARARPEGTRGRGRELHRAASGRLLRARAVHRGIEAPRRRRFHNVKIAQDRYLAIDRFDVELVEGECGVWTSSGPPRSWVPSAVGAPLGTVRPEASLDRDQLDIEDERAGGGARAAGVGEIRRDPEAALLTLDHQL
jgi:hypothetical protein